MGQRLLDVQQTHARLVGGHLEDGPLQGRGAADAAVGGALAGRLGVPVAGELRLQRRLQLLAELRHPPAGQLVEEEGDEEVQRHLHLHVHPG